MEKVCINDFSSEELRVWMNEFYPNGLSRSQLEKSSRVAKIRKLKSKINIFERNEIFDFSDVERESFRKEIAQLNRMLEKQVVNESDFVIARNWYKKSILNSDAQDQMRSRLSIALNEVNFETEILRNN